MRGFYHRRKQRLRELKQGRACLRCGITDPRVLDFHHRDPGDKAIKIGRDAWKVSWERLLSEIEKCDVLCANCHRIEHFEDGTYDDMYKEADAEQAIGG